MVAGMSERDIYECANQLGGYVGPDTEDSLAVFLIRESNEAAKLADEIVRLRAAYQAALTVEHEPVGCECCVDGLQADGETPCPHCAAPVAAPVQVRCYVSEMKTSAGSDYYVTVRYGDRELTPHMYKIKGRADYDVAEWKWIFGQGDKPDILAFDTDEPTALVASPSRKAVRDTPTLSERLRDNAISAGVDAITAGMSIEAADHIDGLEADLAKYALSHAPSRDDVVRECIAVVEQNVLEFTNRERCIAALRAISGDTSK
jgi:hypothetical protein